MSSDEITPWAAAAPSSGAAGILGELGFTFENLTKEPHFLP